MYKSTLTALGTFLALGTFSTAIGGTFKHITIDGNFTDWAGVPIAYSDPSEDGAQAGTDFKDVWIAHDDDYVYVRVSFYNTGNLLRSQNNVFVNADGDTTTGFSTHGTGSEFVIQGGTGYQEKNGTFNDGSTIQDLAWLAAPSGATNEFEFRFSRKAKFDDGSNVFSGTSIGILLETESNNFAEVDIAQDDGPIAYTLDAAPPAAAGNFDLISLAGTDWRFNRSGADPGADWTAINYDDTQAGWETGRSLFGFAPNAAAYPASISTPFTDTAVTHYFRAQFTWDKDTAGLSLIASNFLSDGAILYLNGAEMARIRMPAGPVGFSTPATGPNPNPGKVELIDLPPNSLVEGTNVLAAEVHQSANDTTDLVFGLALFATDRLPVGIASPIAPQTLLIDEGSTATFTVQARGAEPITFQWYKGTTAIPNATNATFIITSVTPEDAGDYLVKASNAGAQNVASPIFTLQPRAVAVTFKDSTLPADLTVMEGGSASFNVAVSGSQPIYFQWFKDGLALSDATNQTYQIDTVSTNDAGMYTCTISNRVTAPLTSRSAKLTVTLDQINPTFLSALGGGTHVTLQFSEPVAAASLVPANFVLTPAVPVTAAHLSTNDSSQVLLDSGALTFGTLYTVTVSGVKDRFGNALPTGSKQQFRATILIDGEFSDWSGIPIAYSDPQDAGPETGAHSDFKDIWIASDNDYIFVHFTLWDASDPFIFYNNLFIDVDNDPTTGYAINGIGSDLLIQGGGGYQETAGTFNAGDVDNLGWLAAPAPPATEFEARFSRLATYVNADAGGLIFKGTNIALVFESENTGFVTQEMAPDAGVGGIVYALMNFQATDLGTIVVARQGANLSVSWSRPTGILQESSSLSPANWQPVANATSPYSVNPNNKEHYYRLSSP